MQHLNYWEFNGFENVYLEDSYVLGIHPSTSGFRIRIEAVLTENHFLYTRPLPGEKYCYRRMTIKFSHPHTYNLVLQNINPIPDPDGSVDYGNIDEFFSDDGKYYLRGEWGELTIVSDPPLLSEDFAALLEFMGGEEVSFEKLKLFYSADNKEENAPAISINFSVGVISK
jgi:hypothetical protein